MYLSRVEIDNNNFKNFRELSHVGAYHNWVERSFPDEIEKNIRTRKLWRIDSLNGKDYLMILSHEKPDLKLLEKYGVENTAITKSYDKFLSSLKEGDELRFRVSVNPVISKSCEGISRGKVTPISGDVNQMNFLIGKSEKNGFSLDGNEFYAVKKNYEVLRKSGYKIETFLKIDFQGILVITDLKKFKEMLLNGLGKKKAFGCGLMTVIPLE